MQHVVCDSFIFGVVLTEQWYIVLHVWFQVFVILGILGEVNIAAQHVMLELGAIVYMVGVVQCSTGKTYY